MNTCNNFFCHDDSKFTKSYARGKSFSFSQWTPGNTYTNDVFKQDFVTYKGDLYGCINTNTNSVPGKSRDWYLVIEKIPGVTFVPHIDDLGNLTWEVGTENENIQPVNIIGPKGEKGERGEKGEVGARGEKGDKGEKGDSGNGNLSVNKHNPDYKGFEGDFHLNIASGEFFKFEQEKWSTIGQISTNNSSIDIEWQDE